MKDNYDKCPYCGGLGFIQRHNYTDPKSPKREKCTMCGGGKIIHKSAADRYRHNPPVVTDPSG